MHHALKSWPENYKLLSGGVINWDIRKNDRGYQIGDTLQYFEWARPAFEETETGDIVIVQPGHFTGRRTAIYRVDLINFTHPGLADGFVILNLYGPYGCNRIMEVPA